MYSEEGDQHFDWSNAVTLIDTGSGLRGCVGIVAQVGGLAQITYAAKAAGNVDVTDTIPLQSGVILWVPVDRVWIAGTDAVGISALYRLSIRTRVAA